MLVTANILAMGFMTPWLFAAGAAGIAVPIIIHLLNRRKFRIVTWAAMVFLLAAHRRNAKRLKFQRWLLLFLRCAALIVLAAAIAQLTLQGKTLSSWVGAGEQTVVIIWDDSYSMNYAPEHGASHFEQSRQALSEFVNAQPASVRLAIIKGATHPEGEVTQATLDHSSVRRAIQDAAPTDDGTDLPAAFERASGVLKNVHTGARSIILITDGAAQTGNRSADSELIKKTLAAITPAAKLRLVDMGQAEQGNLGVTGLSLRRPLITAGIPAELEVRVTNGSPRPVLDVPVTVTLNGTPVSSERIARIDAGATRALLLSVTIPSAGQHTIEARIPADLLPVDDVRRLVVECRRETPVLLVDGSPGDNQQLGSTTFLQLALAPEQQSAVVFSPRVISELELPHTPLSSMAAVVLSDVGSVDSVTAKNLEDFVRGGGLLVIFPGPRSLPEVMNRNFATLLPVTIGPVVRRQSGGGEPPVSFDASHDAHPVLAPFAAASSAGKLVGLTSAETQTYLQLNVNPETESETILRFTTGTPALITRRIGNGRVILSATSADTRWTSLPAKPSFVPLMWELFYFGLSPKWLGESMTLSVGDRINMPGDAAQPGLWSGPEGTTLRVTLMTDSGGRGRLISDPLKKAGVYALAGGGIKVAVNPPENEADIRHLPEKELAAKFGADSVHMQLAEQVAGHKESQDIGRPLLLAALFLFAAETFCARAFSMYRKAGGQSNEG